MYLILPPEAQDWINSLPDNGRQLFQPPSQYDTVNAPTQIQAEVAIISPTTYSYVAGVVPIVGNARGNVGVLPAGVREGIAPTEWLPIGPDHNNQVDNALLENFDTTGLTDDVYTLQLQVVGGDGQIRQSSIQLTVDNTPPRSISPIRPQSRSSCQVRLDG